MDFLITEHNVDTQEVSSAISIVEINNEALVKDVDLATRLGYSRPRKIRELIQRMIDNGRFGSALPWGAFEKAGNGADIEVWYLNEKQSLKVIAESDTVISYQVMDEVMDIFLAYRNGKLVPVQSNSMDILAMFPEALRALASRTEELEATKQLVIELKPQAEYGALVSKNMASLNCTDYAKILSTNELTIPPHALKDFLVESGVLNTGSKLPSQRYIKNGWLEAKPTKDGRYKNAYITALGQEKMAKAIIEHFSKE